VGKSLTEIAKAVIQTEADSVLLLKDRLDQKFDELCHLIRSCKGKIILIGMGKSGHIARKIASTLASTGTPSFYLHPGEAGHGDIGMANYDDIIVMISYSGETDEITLLLPAIKRKNIPIISMTGNVTSSIALASKFHLDVSVNKEACPNNLAPTSSTTAALVMGDAISVAVLSSNNFSSDDFAISHPSGAIGRRLLTLVSTIMKSGKDIPIIDSKASLLDSLLVMSEKSMGMVLITDNDHRLLGIFTDGDLRRVIKSNINIQNISIEEVMSKNCKSIESNKLALLAIKLMEDSKIYSLPVVDDDNKVIGALNMHTLIQAKLF